MHTNAFLTGFPRASEQLGRWMATLDVELDADVMSELLAGRGGSEEVHCLAQM